MGLEWYQVAVVMLVLMFSSCISTATGFGAVVLAIPLCALVISVKVAVPLLSMTSMATCAFMLIREHRHVDWREYRRILMWVGLAFPIGNLGYHFLPIEILEKALGIFVTIVALHGIYRLYHGKPRVEWNEAAGRLILLGGGVMQGALATGGPLVVTYAQHVITNRRAFRATLFLIWLSFNAIFITSSFAGATRQPVALLLAVLCLPSLAIGIWVGNKLHRVASDRHFRVLVLTILLLSGLSLLVMQKGKKAPSITSKTEERIAQ